MGNTNTYDEYKQELGNYKQELTNLLYKSQESFEKQLSFISAGSLALSIGFIKDVVKEFSNASFKFCLNIGWILLGLTLTVNCISHILAANSHYKTIAEINDERYKYERVLKRQKLIRNINVLSVVFMLLGIAGIIFFVIKNIW